MSISTLKTTQPSTDSVAFKIEKPGRLTRITSLDSRKIIYITTKETTTKRNFQTDGVTLCLLSKAKKVFLGVTLYLLSKAKKNVFTLHNLIKLFKTFIKSQIKKKSHYVITPRCLNLF